MRPAFAVRITPRFSAGPLAGVSKPVGKQLSTDDLRDLYKITTPGDIDLARAHAKSSSSTLATYLEHRPIASHTLEAYESFRRWRERPGARRRLAIDAGCGTGQSAVAIARELGDVDVVGVDKSIARLSRNAVFRGDPMRSVGNALLLRAELVDFWSLCLRDSCFPDYHFLLYPNPYPKQGDMKRRWHGHPVFPVIVALGGRLEIRASWPGYLHEFRSAYEAVKVHAPNDPLIGNVEELNRRKGNGKPLTNFESKYMIVGHAVHRLVIDARGSEARDCDDNLEWIGSGAE